MEYSKPDSANNTPTVVVQDIAHPHLTPELDACTRKCSENGCCSVENLDNHLKICNVRLGACACFGSQKSDEDRLDLSRGSFIFISGTCDCLLSL